MLLAIDIGNTNIVVGGVENDQIVFEARLATDRIKTSDQYGGEIKNPWVCSTSRWKRLRTASSRRWCRRYLTP